jgi:serine/threonine protein kinase/formylglycine-generating enzyme required for sulfatase activity
MNEQEIFFAALDIEDLFAREQYLREACGENAELLGKVRALLDSHDNVSRFLDTPALQQVAGASQGEIDATILHGAQTTHGDEDERGPDDEVPLGYLQPSSQAGSLGRLGHYEILEVIGQGAFGTVLRARDEKLQRVVAIKVLSPEMAATSPARKRFLREARSSAKVRHENVVSIYAVEDHPIPYLVMEYIPGKTLQQRLDEKGPLDFPDVLRLGKQIADGLAAAHAEGLIHRDVKPGNILLEGGMDDRVKITDFGLARTADDASMTQSGVIAGTPMYMAPEQALGHKLDQRADLFSLGSVLYQMLSGRPPFRASTTVAVLKRVVDDTPRPIQEVIPEVPDWMCKLLGHLHAKNPDERYASASEVSDLLARCANDLRQGRVPEIPDPSQVAEQLGEDAAASAAASKTADESALVKASREHAFGSVQPRRRESILHRPLLKVAAAVLIVLGVLSVLGITEATGVTKLSATVMRVVYGSGTLVIETDDPSIKVAIDGEVLQISGAGIAELTLRPGEHEIFAIKDGKPIKRELVEITRNGRLVLRISLEPPSTAASEPADDRVVESGAGVPPPLAKAPFDAEQAKAHQQAWADYLGVPVEKEIVLGQDKEGNDVQLTMVLIPPGEFLMGTNGIEVGKLIEERKAEKADANTLLLKMEGPQHFVRITKPFWLSKYEFTTGQFRQFVESTGYQTDAETNGKGGFKAVDGKAVQQPDVSWEMLKNAKGDQGPVVNVSWNDADECCKWLSKQNPPWTFSLPTEAQWEYACRAGSTTPWYGCETEEELQQYAWFETNSKWIQRCGRLKPNAFGLYDMHGNVWEWCLDWVSGIYRNSPTDDPVRTEDVDRPLRVNRGGCFYNPARSIRAAKRGCAAPESCMFDRGFRVAAAISDDAL